MSDLICITNRNLCKNDFLKQIENIAKAHPKAIVLREKDLSAEEYMIIANQVIKICKMNNTVCILHSFTDVSKMLGCRFIHLPLHILKNMKDADKKYFDIIGVSCHSEEEAVDAEKLGCTYITAGHIFNTDCKKGLPGRGLEFLQSVCNTVNIPVYAIGGIGKENYSDVKKAGACGACIMSGFMTCNDTKKYIEEIECEY